MVAEGFQTLDRYQLEGLIGEGGFGAVYRARHLHTKQVVAIKVLRNTAASGIDAQRLVREAQVIASIRHPNIVQVYDAGIASGVAFFAMELVQGTSLEGMLRAQGPMPWTYAKPAILQLLAGLTAAHRVGAVHRDIKPQNVLMAHDGTLKILDFGISKTTGAAAPVGGTQSPHTLTGHGWLGTPGYMAPEQYRGTVDARADIYAVGVTLFVMLTGRLPYLAETPEALYTQTMQSRAPLVSVFAANVPASVVEAIDRALARDPDARFASAEAFQAALTAPMESATPATVAGQRPIVAPINTSTAGATAFYASQRANTNPGSRKVWSVVAITGMVAVSALAFGAWHWTHRPEQRESASGTVVERSQTIVRRGMFTETQHCREAETIRYENAEISVSGVGIEISDACDLLLVNTKIVADIGIAGDMGDVVMQGGSIVARDTAIQVRNGVSLRLTSTQLQAAVGMKLGGPAKLNLQDTTILSTKTGIESELLTDLEMTRGEIRASVPIVIRGAGKVHIVGATLVGQELALDLGNAVERTITGGHVQGRVQGGSGATSGAAEKVLGNSSGSNP